MRALADAVGVRGRGAVSATANGPAGALGSGALLPESLRAEMADMLARIPLDSGGGATLLKVLMLGDLIVERPVARAVEIGVYRGRLLLPLALVMRWRGEGEILGIDPYSAVAAEQHDEHEVGIDLRSWPSTIDWEELHDGVHGAIVSSGLEPFARLVRARSEDVAGTFEPGSIDLLHVDGNHDAAAVAADAELYLPLVCTGGYVVLDDPSWASVRPVFDDLCARHELLFRLYDGRGLSADGVGGNDFAVFRLRA